MFTPKVWKDRVVQYPANRKLIGTSDPSVFQVQREEGIIITEGDKINADALNDLEQRIAIALNDGPALQNIYTVGAYWISADPTSPALLFGFGEWVRVKGKMLLGVDEEDSDFNQVLGTGGSKTHTGVASHSHSIPALTGSAASAGAHTHTGPSHTHTSAAHVHALAGSGAQAAWTGDHNHTIRRTYGNYAQDATSGNHAEGKLMAGFYGNPWSSVHSWSEVAGGHAHSLSGSTASTTPGATGASGTGATGSSGAHTHTITTTANNTGYSGVVSVDHMNPFELCYIWRRTA